jgi:DNA-binding transcriptional regulator GbsR (MarR family)
MNEKLVKAQDVMLDKINIICKKFGLNNIMAQLYAILYLSAKPLSLDDMVERLKISKGSASINIRALERYGVVKRVWVKGSRKDYYDAEPDISKVIMDRIQAMARLRLSEISSMINASNEAIGRVSSNGGAEEEAVMVFKDRLEKLSVIYNQAQAFFDLFNSTLLSNNFFAVRAASPKDMLSLKDAAVEPANKA